MVDETRNQETEQSGFLSLSGGGGRGAGKRPTRIGSGGDGDWYLYNRIMRVIRKIERKTGAIPDLFALSEATGISTTRIKKIQFLIHGNEVRFLVSTRPARFGERVVLSFIDKAES